MTKLERKFMTLGCNFFGSQSKRSDFIEVHVCENYIAKESMGNVLINKRAIVLIEPSDTSNMGGVVKSTIHTANETYLTTETYEQLKKMLS